jgi:hypothetical protein
MRCEIFLRAALGLTFAPGCASEAPSGAQVASGADASVASGGASGAATDAGLGEPTITFSSYEEGRYCEVLVVGSTADGNLLADVYNSLGLGSCPQDAWDALDAAAIQADFPDAVTVVLNGPRFFLMQELYGGRPDAPQVHDFTGIKMILVATVEITPEASIPYTEVHVNRDNTFRFTAGARVFELHGPSDRVYVMQSFSRIVDPGLAYEDLETLASRVAPPEGWSYVSRVLDADLDVRATGVATVVQDELKNTYQLVE